MRATEFEPVMNVLQLGKFAKTFVSFFVFECAISNFKHVG